MAVAAQAMDTSSLRLIHRGTIDDAAAIRRLFARLHATGIPLRGGIDGQINQRRALVREIRSRELVLETQNFSVDRLPQLYLQFELGGSRYFFAADVIQTISKHRLLVAIPPALHEAERRELPRHSIGAGETVELSDGQSRHLGQVLDRSYDGIGVRIDGPSPWGGGQGVQLKHLAGSAAGEAHAVVRNSVDGSGWSRIGLSVSKVPFGPLIGVEKRQRILGGTRGDRALSQLGFVRAAVGMTTVRVARALRAKEDRPRVRIVSYLNDKNQVIKGIVDSWGPISGATCVVMPPAWGRTKETMLPLAATIRETFARTGQPIVVLRYDGTNRRGESWIDPDCRAPGSEYLHFRFSQSVRDMHASLVFAANEFQPSRIVLVTTSLASIEGRRAVATDPTGLVTGWVSLVGMVDLHSGLRAASGGVDYAFGLQRGAVFGRHEIAGVVADMDATGKDVLDHQLGLFEDARRDMAAIRVPVTWIHGKHDGWIELERVRSLMSAGPQEARRVIEVPTGHQLRSSRMALETFELVAAEVGRIAFGRQIRPRVPPGRELEAKRRAERDRRPKGSEDLREFWRRYVVGRDGSLGIEILAATRAYSELMATQIEALELDPGHRVLDLGAGAGDFSVALAERLPDARAVNVTALDLVPEALERGRARVAALPVERRPGVSWVRADLDKGSLPCQPGSYDAVLASLLISYVKEPENLLAELRGVLRPGGRLVLSVPRRDADLSKIYVDGIRELDPATVRRKFGEDAERVFASLQRELLHEGARLLSLEEEGWFRFYDLDELRDLVVKSGFEPLRAEWAFGDPPQVALVSARRN